MSAKVKAAATSKKATRASTRTASVKPSKPAAPPAVVEAPANKTEKAKKRKLDVESDDDGLEKKRRKSVKEDSEAVKGEKAAEGKKPTAEGKGAKKVSFGKEKATSKKGISQPTVTTAASATSKPKAPKTKKAAEPVDNDEEKAPEEAEGVEVAADDEDVLHGFSSGSDSSDEDDDGVDAAPLDVAKLPTIAKDDETVRRRLERAKRQKTEDHGVLYLGRIPHGFYEDQMRSYFGQFGSVTRLRLSRNKKTGRSKHYAFIEFDSLPVAEIVADTMNNYLMFGHLLQCRLIPNDKVHPELWVGANRKFRPVPLQRVTRLSHNKDRTEAQQAKSNERLLKRQEEKKRKLAEIGIDYDMDAAGFKQPASVKA